MTLHRILESAVGRAVAEGLTSGAQVAVWSDGRLVTAEAGGTSWPEHTAAGRPTRVTANTLFDLASLTKAVVTAPLAWIAIGEGVLRVDEGLDRLLPEWAPSDRVTLRHLLNHTSGLPAWLALYGEVRGAGPDPAAMRRLALATQLATPTGEGAVYSDVGYMLLGIALERALGAPLDALATSLILGPLGMTRTGFRAVANGDVRPVEVAATEATCFAQGDKPLAGEVHDENAWRFGGIAGHAGLFGTAWDLVTFGRTLLGADGGRTPWSVAPAVLRWALSAASATTRDGLRVGSHLGGLDTPSGERSSAGPLMTTDPPGATVGHLGFTGTSLWVDRSRQLVVALLTNRVHPHRDRVSTKQINAFRRALHTEVCEEIGPGATNIYPVATAAGVPILSLADRGRRELDAAMDIARRAGAMVLGRQRSMKSLDIRHKGKVDLVTSTDLESQDLIVGQLRAAFPSHTIVAEEKGMGSLEHTQGPVWIVDPLDGTTNFAHGLPHFAINIALAIDGELQLAVTYDPSRDELFSAVRGQGARLNGHLLGVSPCRHLVDALAATGFPYDRQDAAENNSQRLFAMLRVCQGVRRFGSAALDLAYVAAGRFDIYWEARLQPWDLAPGVLLVEEAGGIVTRIDGSRWHLDAGEALATCGPVHTAAIATLQTSP